MNNFDNKKFPFAAKTSDLTTCLEHLGNHPLKLVAEKLFTEYKESAWEQPIWSFSTVNSAIKDKKLLINAQDSFQVSVANEKSKQDFHKHLNVYDIYMSHSAMEVIYIEADQKKSIKIPEGILIVPPNLYHKVKLHGLTFVFQTSTAGTKIHKDKKVSL